MHISALEEYGLRCALQLARHYSDGHVPASQIALREGVSTEYVSKVMFLFRKAGLITAERGIQGGFMLARAPGEITLKQVLDSVASNKGAGGHDFCSGFAGKRDECVHLGGCSVRPVWNLISTYFSAVLRDLTLSDLIGL
jgi:Rrf2 family cysteine metabolism transcriptional repressor